MNIIGERVVLLAIRMKDASLLLNLINDPETEQMLGGSSFPVSMEAQKNWIVNQAAEKNVLRCIITEKDGDDDGLGTIVLNDIDEKNGTAQIHIKLDKHIGRNKGFGTDAIKSIVSYAFQEMRLNCIYAEILEDNIPSQRLFTKCGFKKEGELRARVFKNGKYKALFSYSIVYRDINSQ